MQPLPFDVLQRREQQGEGEAAARRCASRESAEGGREVDPREHTSRAAPLYLAAQDRAYATSPPPSPTPATWLDGPSAEEASRGRGLTRPKLAPATPPQGGVTTRKRPPLGPRTQTPPSWPPATETVPPQFLGGRVGPDARRLSWRGDKGLEMASSNEIDELRLTLSTRSPSPGQSDSQTPRQEQSPTIASAVAQQERTVPNIPDEQEPEESLATSTESTSSTTSWASSFAHLLRDRRSDTRLFHKRSKPLQHQQNRPSPPRPVRPDAARSPSYYRPRIVEDTRRYVSPVRPVASSVISYARASETSTDSQESASTLDVLSPYSAGRAQDHSSSSRAHNVPAQSARSRSPALLSVPSNLDLVDVQTTGSQSGPASPSPARKKFRIQLPPPYFRAEHSGQASAFEDIGLASADPKRADLDSEVLARAGAFTPSEISTVSPRIGHGSHYFRTFGEDTVYEKTHPAKVQGPAVIAAVDQAVTSSSQPRTQLQSTPSDHTTVHHPSRKPRNLLLALRKLPLTDNSLNVHETLPGSPSPRSHDPMKSFLATSRHTRTSDRSDGSASSYFGPGRRQRDSSEHPLLTPAVAAHSKTAAGPPDQNRDNSEPLSPTSRKSSKSKWKSPSFPPRSEEGGGFASESKNERGSAPAAPDLISAPHIARSVHTYTSSDGKKYPVTNLTALDAPNFLPSEMKRVDTPSLQESSAGRRKLRAFRSLFIDELRRPRPIEEEDYSVRTSSRVSVPQNKGQKSILPKASLRSLLSRLSAPRLRNVSSTMAIERRESDPLAVTAFEQTPFSQRYGDARRAKQMQMRAYIWDETLHKNSDSSFGSADHTFELNIPDHLTNSPLCPLNEKHRSGGRAVCPIHGRRKMNVNACPAKGRATGRREGSQAWREPTIVFESGKAGSVSSE